MRMASFVVTLQNETGEQIPVTVDAETATQAHITALHRYCDLNTDHAQYHVAGVRCAERKGPCR